MLSIDDGQYPPCRHLHRKSRQAGTAMIIGCHRLDEYGIILGPDTHDGVATRAAMPASTEGKP